MYALVEIAGKQYKAEEGKVLRVDYLGEEKEEGSSLEINSVMLLSQEGKTIIGKPFVEGSKIKATFLKHTLGDKVVAYKYKRRKDYERKVGHRQDYSLIKVEKIVSA